MTKTAALLTFSAKLEAGCLTPRLSQKAFACFRSAALTSCLCCSCCNRSSSVTFVAVNVRSCSSRFLLRLLNASSPELTIANGCSRRSRRRTREPHGEIAFCMVSRFCLYKDFHS